MRALVLCAGFGTRLGNLVQEVPKPMLSLGPGPLLEYVLRNLARQGVTDVAINLHYRPDVIRNYFGSGAQLGLNLEYFYEPELLGTAGTVKHLADFLAADGPFLVHYGDVVTNQDFHALEARHAQHQALATILVHQRPGSNSIVELDHDGRITSFVERPTNAERRITNHDWVHSGVSLLDPSLIDLIPGGPCDLPRDVFVRQVGTRRLFAVPLTSQRIAVDSPQRLAMACELAAECWPELPLATAGAVLHDTARDLP